MRKCPVCGNENEDGAKICTQCGREISDQSADVEEVKDFPTEDWEKEERPATRALEVLRRGAGAGVFRLAVFLYMLMVIYNVASLVLDEMIFFKVISTAQRWIEETMMLPVGVLDEISGGIFSLSNVAALLILLPEVLCFLGMAMYALSASHITEPSKDTGGLLLIQVAVCIEMIFYLMIGLLVMGVFLISMLREWDLGFLDPQSMTMYLVFMGLALVVILFVVFYELGVIRILRSMKNTMRTGEADDRISGYVIFMNFAMSILVFVVSFLMIPYTEIEGFIVSAVGTLVTVLLTCGLIWYRKQMRGLCKRA